MTICLLAISMGLRAQSAKAAWLAMPDSLLPYMPKESREECVDLKERNLEAKVTNLLRGETVLDTLTSSFLQVRLSRSAMLQMRVLPAEGGDSLICVVKTLNAPAKESEIMFYDAAWRPVPRLQQAMDAMRDSLPAKLLVRPDSMSEERFSELSRMIDPVMVYATLSMDEDVLTFSLSTPLLSDEDRKSVACVLSQRKFKWDGHSFNEY